MERSVLHKTKAALRTNLKHQNQHKKNSTKGTPPHIVGHSDQRRRELRYGQAATHDKLLNALKGRDSEGVRKTTSNFYQTLPKKHHIFSQKIANHNLNCHLDEIQHSFS